MFDIELDSLDADRLLTHVVEVRALAQRAEVRTLEVAAAWADLHGVIETTGVTLPGSERLVQFGGDGTPETCEFCPAELGAEMGMSPAAQGRAGSHHRGRPRLRSSARAAPPP